ncbi:MAG TPA: DinB family protein [Anaerolineales bacterium]
MDIKDYLKEAYDYMYWATGRYVAVAEGLTEAQLHQVQGHSWGEIHATLVHMMSSEWVWLQRWHGTSPKAHLDQSEFPTLPALQKRWSQVEAEMRAFVGAQNSASLQRAITYNNFRGETFDVPLWQMLVHIVNHETHHRGELAAMYALMGVSHPEDEMIQYFLNASGQKKF